MCLITSLLRKQSLIVIWGRAHAHCTCTLVDPNDVGFSYCLLYKHGAGGCREGDGVPCRPHSASIENCKARVSLSSSFAMQRSFAAWKYLRHHWSRSPWTYRWRCFIFAAFPSLSSIYLFARASLGYLITHLPPENAAVAAAWIIIGESLQNLYWFAFKIQTFRS